MNVRSISLIGLVFLSACANPDKARPDSAPLSERQIDKIDSICRSFIEKGNTVGLSMALSHKGRVVFARGYGLANIESEQQATDSTIYAIASVSKFITAITTMRMVEQGKLSLSDKVIDHLNEFPRQQFMDEITIEHLLRHQSGLVDHEDWLDSIFINENRVFTDQELYQFLDQPLFFKPGTNFSYSNSGYALLSRILEKIEQKSFDNLIRDEVGYPLEITSLGMWPGNWNNNNASMGYEMVKGKLDTSLHMMTKGMKGDGGLSASVVDLLKFMDKVVDESLISRASLDAMLSPSKIGSISIESGIGVRFGDYNGQETFGHSGGYKGTGWAMLFHYPESGFTFAAAMNTNYSPEEIWNLRHLIMPVVLNFSPPVLSDTQTRDFVGFAGTYSTFNRWGDSKPDVRKVIAKDGKLYWDNPDTKEPGTQIFQINDSVFTWKQFPYDNFRFHFLDGKVIACSEYYDGMFGGVRFKMNQN